MVRARTTERGSLVVGAAAVLIALALALFATYAMRYQQQQLTRNTSAATVLARIDAALADFVARNKRLPCPADGALASGAAGVGIETVAAGACNPANQQRGVVPWITLGLTEDQALDPWNRRISYRVQPSLASSTLTLMNMSWCDPAGAITGANGVALACNAPCTGAACRHPLNYLYGKGLQVKDAGGAWLNQPAPAWPASPLPPPPASSGAAYVLVSHGPNGLGAYIPSGAWLPGAAGNEARNANNTALVAATIFIDTARDDTPLTTFDDQLSHPTIAALLAAAALGPRTPH